MTALIELARKLFPAAEIGVISSSDAYSMNDAGEMRHTRSLVDKVLYPILPSPRRGKLQHCGMVDSFKVQLAIICNSLKDAVWSLSFLAVCRYSSVAKFFLGKSQRSTYEFIRTSDYFFIKGGGFIYAYRGLRYRYYLYFQLYLIMLAARLKVPIIIMPNSFGPFETRFSKHFASRALNKCRLIGTRERISDERLREIGVRENIIVSLPDMAFMTKKIQADKAETLLKNAGLKSLQNLVGFTVRPWRFPNHKNPQQAWADYIDSIVALANYVIEKGYRPVFFPQSIGPHDHEDDRIAIRAVCEKLVPDSYNFVDGDWLPSELAGMYAMMDFFVGTRMHSVIFAMISSVPVIAISYQGPKAKGIMEDIGVSDYVVDIESVNPVILKRMFDSLVQNKQALSDKIRRGVAGLIHQLEDWEQRIKEECCSDIRQS